VTTPDGEPRSAGRDPWPQPDRCPPAPADPRQTVSGSPPPGPYLSDGSPEPVDRMPVGSPPPGPFLDSTAPSVPTGPVSEYRENWLRRALHRLRGR
jgi:hypothetical protein